ncbi:coiled-coil domain-containing protein 78-like isoform X2 [Acanthaster planci]|nr:coiled-coil domain-containing protein 78-like isoform X2 [Acanthaster planci]XP_022097215.1 coiled-coil domain-containing protein 78-like isoform X2 [Acanthaster planci]XP_022097216.1 coiled-coil domain-containing protein 78-like isoform X2 [Acanthaster planci]
MNVTVLGRIRPSTSVGSESSGSYSGAHGQAHPSFQTLYKQGDTNRFIYSDAILSMVKLLGAGFNCCVLCFGESGSGKSYTLAGEGTGQPGIIQMMLKDLFNEVDRLHDNGTSAHVKIGMYEIYNEIIRDLLSIDRHSAVCDLGITAEDGVYVKNLIEVPVMSASDSLSIFHSGWLAQNTQNTDYGEAGARTTVVTRIHLIQEREEYGYPYKSTFTFVDLPGAEKLAADPKALKRMEGTLLNKSLLALGSLIEELARKPGAARILSYEASKLTNLLRDALGGNCNTKVIVHQKPRSDARITQAVLNAAECFGQITNFFLLNDTAAQGLITQYRAQLLIKQSQLPGPSAPAVFDSDDLAGKNAKLTKENMKLKEEEGYLRRKLDQLDSRLGDVAMVKTDLSAKLINSEEEKLRVSKLLVDLQIENNRIKEKASQEIFELNNKLMSIDSDYREVLMAKERLGKETRLFHERLDLVERERQELADKYVMMKADYAALAEKYDSEVSRNQELGLELLNLLNAKVTLLKQEENLALASDHKREQTAEELRRARDIALGLSSKKERADEIGASDLDRRELQNKLFGDEERMRSEFNQMRNQYDQQQDKLQSRIMELNAALRNGRQITRDYQRKLAQQDVELISSREEAREVAVANSRLQTQLMEKNEEMRSRLTKYLEDIAEFVDDRDATLNRKMEDNLTNYVRSMIKDMKETYKAREKQLSEAARDFKMKMQSIGKKHEQLLVAYRFLRKQVQKGDISDADLGPQEGELTLKDDEVESANRREIRRLTEALLEAQKKQSPADSDDSGEWNELQKKLGEFTSKTQQELETERASLMSMNAILEEQLAECHDYINRHFNKYREENASLRRMLGMKEREGNTYEDPPIQRRQRAGYPRLAGPSHTQPSWQY